MGARPGTSTKPTKRGEQPRPGGRGARKLNRSEQQAMRIRAAANAAARLAAADDTPTEGAKPIRSGESGQRAPTRTARMRAAFQGVAISRAQEMAYIRADLRRMLIIAGVIMVAMFALIVVLPT